jgi:DNA-binding Lrp family transcriptional regulator
MFAPPICKKVLRERSEHQPQRRAVQEKPTKRIEHRADPPTQSFRRIRRRRRLPGEHRSERSEPLDTASASERSNQIRMTAMLTAIVFVKAEVARISQVAEEIAALSGVSEVYSVTGAIDLIVMIRVANHDQIAEVVADRLNKVPGVVSTETHIAFRAYSAHDLEAAFSLGG